MASNKEYLNSIKMFGDYSGYKIEKFIFLGKMATIIFPNKPIAGNKWLFKTEYLGAFPTLEEEMIKLGYAVAHVDNNTRWRVEEDTERQNAFCEYLTNHYGFNKKCVPIGMSCGGMQAIYLTARHPDKIACLYLDAPVVNFLSVPYCLGNSKLNCVEEFEQGTGMNAKFLINYRNQPLDNLHYLIENNIPAFLVCGDSDTQVPYEENGIFIKEIYEKSNVPFGFYLKENCDHHPHGLIDNKMIIDFVEKHYD